MTEGYPINGSRGSEPACRRLASVPTIKEQEKASRVDPGLQPRARSAPEEMFLFRSAAIYETGSSHD